MAWVSPFAPDARGGGGAIRQAQLLTALSKCADITLLCPGPLHDTSVRASVAAFIEVDQGRSPGPGRGWRVRLDDLWGALFASLPREARAMRGFRQSAQEALKGLTDIDVVIVEFEGLAPLAQGRAAMGSARWILTLHNLQSHMAAQQRTVMPKARQRFLFRRDTSRAGSLERLAVTIYDHVVVMSAADAALIGGPRTHVVPNGVDLVRFRPSPLPAGPTILFAGALYTTPNFDGVIWFCTHVLPIVRRAVPGARLSVVGAQPPLAVTALGDLPGVEVHPNVDDVIPYLTAARAVVAPLRIGSGTRIKVLEAWAAGRPVVATTIAMEGLPSTDGYHVLLADQPERFAEQVIRLLRNDVEAMRLAWAGRELVESTYDASRIADQFVALVLHAVARPASR